MALSADTPRTFIEVLNGGVIVDAFAEESQTFYRGAAVGLDATDQNVQPLEDGDVFLGICLENKTIGSTGGTETVKVQVGGVVKIPVTSVAKANLGAAVFATDDGTFILTSTGNASVGRVVHVPATGTAWVMLKTPGEALGAAQTAAASVT